MNYPPFLPTRVVLFALCPLLFALPGDAQQIDFNHQVVPILRQHCLECHGGQEAKGGFSINSRALLIESGHVQPGSVVDSYLIELVESDDPDFQMPPAEHARLSPEQIATLKRWIQQDLPWQAGFSFAPTVYEPPLRPRRPELPQARDGRTHPIDRILDADLAARDLAPPASVDDETFLRRVTLDLVGLLPEPDVRRAFLEDTRPDKRARYIDRLLEDPIDYADHWLTFFNDLLRNDYSGTGFITGGRKQISGWLYQSLLENKPFDQMTRELVAPPTDASRGYIDGIRWRGTVSAGQSNEIQFAQSVAQSFLGINLKCASCHDSFIDRWTLDDAYALAAVYASEPLELHRCDKPTGRTARAGWLFPELGQIDAELPPQQRLEQLAGLMTDPENGRFARTIVNRLWYRLMGQGIVHPLDAMQSQPANEDLLDYLGTALVDHDYDLKQVLRLIATSQAYQSQTLPQTTSAEDHRYRGPVARRLTAEQFLDAVWQITGAAPAKFDAPIERTAEPAPMVRAGLLKNTALMRSLGRPGREQIVSMRPDQLSTLEAINLANQQLLADAFASGARRLVEQPWEDPQELIRHVYQFTLSRQPDTAELATLTEYLGAAPSADGVQDMLWAVCMLPEFWLVR